MKHRECSPRTEVILHEEKRSKTENLKKIKKVLAFFKKIGYNIIRGCDTQRNSFWGIAKR